MFIQCGRRGFARPRKPGQFKQRNVIHVHQSYYIVEAGTYNGIFWTGDFRTKKIPAHDYHSDDDVSALNNSDSDILATVEKADFVEFLDDDS